MNFITTSLNSGITVMVKCFREIYEGVIRIDKESYIMVLYGLECISDWWFGLFLFFPILGNSDPN